MTQPFDRPVFIMAAPRSCSTLLFQTLAGAEALWSLGDESHRLFESHAKLSPGRGFVDSNRLTADLLDERLAQSLRNAFATQVRNRRGERLPTTEPPRVRLLEKTPKHALRIPFLDALFPDALFVYLFRDPRENISSIIDAWRSGRFVTYPRFATAHGPWSLLLPPGWRDCLHKPLEEIAAFQWATANRYIMQDLAALPPQRWTALNAAELLQDAPGAVRRLCEFMEVPLDAELAASLERPLPPSRYTLSQPDPQKWQRNGALLARVETVFEPLVPAINRFVAGRAQPLAAATAAPAIAAPVVSESPAPAADEAAGSGRNRPCPCGSGRRFKACHGALG